MSTPEAKLLALIKGDGARKTAGAFRERFRPWKVVADRVRGVRERFSGLSPWQAANRCLAVVLLGAVLYGAGSGLRAGKKEDPLSSLESRGIPPESASPRKAPSAVSLQEMTRRNLFQPLIVAPPPPPKAMKEDLPPPPPKIPLSQRAAYLRLTGIITGDALQAVIEDRNNGSTRYVSAGDSIDGILVEKVLPDRVILSLEAEKMELTL